MSPALETSTAFEIPVEHQDWYERLRDDPTTEEPPDDLPVTPGPATEPSVEHLFRVRLAGRRTDSAPDRERVPAPLAPPLRTTERPTSPPRPISLGVSGDVLLVASKGGHFTQLQELVRRLEPEPRSVVWCTYDSSQAREVLAGEQWIRAHGPSTRSLPNAARNAVLARRTFRDRDFDAVISTGAGVAVPFLAEAARRGIAAHYIESATRIDGPSLSGRMLARIGDVQLWNQYATASWGPSWRHVGSVFDGFSVVVGRPKRPSRVFVTLGSHDFPFPRAVAEIEAAIDPMTSVTWQLGTTPAPPELPGEHHVALDPSEQARAIAEADVVIAHAGTGIALDALRQGKQPVLLARTADLGEHVDDHQQDLAAHLASEGLAISPLTHALTRDEIERAASACVSRTTTA